MKEYLFQINNWWTTGDVPSEYQDTIPREKTREIEQFIYDREILTLIGPRRSGKTTIIYQLIHSLLQSGTNPKHIMYISLDDPEITLDMGDDLFIRLFESYQEIILRELKDQEIYVFIDEVQYFKGWEMWLKKYFDQYPNIKFIVSGSSSLAIKDEFAALTGRNLRFLIYPFSYREFILARDNILIEKTAFSYKNFEDAYNAVLPFKNKLILLFQEYLCSGGYPRTINEDAGKSREILKQYFYDTIYKDILKMYPVRDVRALESIAAYLAQNIGNRFSFRKISSALGIDVDTVIRYVKYLEETYLVFMLNYFSYSSKAVIQKEKKIYMIDTGLRNAISTSVEEPLQVENCVFTHLIRKFENVSYWRDVEEVDFIVSINNTPLPVEVKYQNSIGQSDIRSVLKFCKRFKLNKGIIVTKNDLRIEVFNGVEVCFIPVWLFISVI